MSDKLPLAMRVEEITPWELDVLVKAGETPSPTVERLRNASATKRYLEAFDVSFTRGFNRTTLNAG